MTTAIVGTNCQSHKRAAIRGAFTLVEVMMAVLVVGVAFVSLYLGFTQGFGTIQVARENLRATQILQEKMETIRLLTWDQIAAATLPANNPYTFTNYFYPPGVSGQVGIAYTGTRTITDPPVNEAYSNDMKMVTFKLTWTSGRVLRQREMKTLVSQYGLHNYIWDNTK
jgi:prepilin-type N-terminal cleavage/methylation domain-containing protein